MSKNNRTIINVVCSIAVLCTNVIISFFLSPYIVDNIGVEANGFVTMANNFVAYAQLVVTALNSMAARYITIEYIKKDFKKANLYYNSVFWGNLIIVAVLIIPASFFIAKMEMIINVPNEIVLDVKILFSFIFFNFFLTTGAPNWDCGTYITNRLDRMYIPQMVTALFRCVFIFVMFTILVPHVWYVGITASIVSVICLVVNGYNTHKLTPELRISCKRGKLICSWSVIKDLVGSGIWNSISNVANIFLSGLDLIICNLALGPTAMGIVSLSKILPNYLQQFSLSICNAFAPELTINYAKGDMQSVLKDMRRAMKLTSVVLVIPLAGIIVLGDSFFKLWVPSQDAGLLQILSVLAILGYMFTCGTQILYNVFPTVNKVKQNSIAMIISGVVSIVITLVLINYTNLGIYAVAGVSTFANTIRNMCFTVPAAAKYLGFKWNQFFPQVAMSMFSSIVLIVIGFMIKPFLPSGSWLYLFISAAIIGLIGLIINITLILNKEERNYLINKILSKFKH